MTLPLRNTYAVPEPTVIASGEVTPLASFTFVSFNLTTWTTTFFAETCVPSESVCGTVPWKRSQAFVEELHFQYTSAAHEEKGRCTSLTFVAPAGARFE